MERFRGFITDLEILAELQARSRIFREPPAEYLEHTGGKSPVILIPGLLERWGVLETIADSVSARPENGYDVYTVPGLGDNKFGIIRSAGIVEEVIVKNNLNDVIIIAHSKGGLIGKQVLIDGLAEKMFAVATPFLGSGPARWIPSRPFRELSSRGREIRRLHKNYDVNGNIISIFAKNDEFTRDGCYLEGAMNNIEMRVKGHFRILEHGGLITYITDMLEFWEKDKQDRK